jgi:hypothetical protein
MRFVRAVSPKSVRMAASLVLREESSTRGEFGSTLRKLAKLVMDLQKLGSRAKVPDDVGDLLDSMERAAHAIFWSLWRSEDGRREAA